MKFHKIKLSFSDAKMSVTNTLDCIIKSRLLHYILHYVSLLKYFSENGKMAV